MEQLSKHVRKLLRQAVAEAHRRELDRELATLHADFEQWQAGGINAFELADRIHQFHQGPTRELYNLYHCGDTLLIVTGAVRREILRLEELHPDLHAPVQSVLERIKAAGW